MESPKNLKGSLHPNWARLAIRESEVQTRTGAFLGSKDREPRQYAISRSVGGAGGRLTRPRSTTVASRDLEGWVRNRGTAARKLYSGPETVESEWSRCAGAVRRRRGWIAWIKRPRRADAGDPCVGAGGAISASCLRNSLRTAWNVRCAVNPEPNGQALVIRDCSRRLGFFLRDNDLSGLYTFSSRRWLVSTEKVIAELGILKGRFREARP